MQKIISITAILLTLILKMNAEQQTEPFKVAAVEFNPVFMQLDTNVNNLQKTAEKVAKQGAKLIVFPEMASCGYIYKDRAQVEPFLDTIPGKITNALSEISKKYNVYIVVGIGEKDVSSNMGYNATALIGPNGYIGKYRKVGLNSTDQIWVSPGNLGHPVFETELGKITMLICYDDIYFQTSRLPSLKGADIIAYSVSSDRALLSEKSAVDNHSTIANVQYMSAWNGVHVICADRSNTEANPETGLVVHYNGASSIWDGNGNKIAQMPYTDSSTENTDAPKELYSTIDPKNYQNPIKSLYPFRRPELYSDLNLFRAPTDPQATAKTKEISALAVQYQPIFGDISNNLNKVRQLIENSISNLAVAKKPKPNLIVMPDYSLTGYSNDIDRLKALAQTMDGEIVMHFIDRAVEYNSFIIFSFLERSNDQYYHTAILLDNKGRAIGKYRKSHLNETERTWMQSGNALSVFETELGRIGMIIDDEVLFPEIAGVLSINRADIIAVPAKYDHSSLGNNVQIDPKLFIKPYPKNTMIYWYSIAQTAQAYTIVANFVGSDVNYKGSSGLYGLDPVMGHYPPSLASVENEEAFSIVFKTLGKEDWWMNQHKLVGGRRADLAVPMTLPISGTAFIKWKNSPGWDNSTWSN